MERRLGRGLSSLLSSETRADESSVEIPVEQIRPNPFQPRKVFDAQGLEELSSSLRRHGLLQPIVLRKGPEGYELIAGERRWRAARLAGWKAIPAVVRDGVASEQMLELALIENVQRRDLDPMERAEGYRGLMESLGLTQEEMAQRVGLQRATVTNHLRLLELAEAVQDGVRAGLLSMGHARALLGIEDADGQVALMKQIVKAGLSVREVERRVRSAKKPASEAATTLRPAKPPWALSWERKLRDSLGTKVALNPGANHRGQIVIDYFDRDDLDRLLERLAPQRTLA